MLNNFKKMVHLMNLRVPILCICVLLQNMSIALADSSQQGIFKQSTILIIGDSLSAAYQMEVSQGWVSLLQEKLAQKYPKWRIVNASISGDTTSNALQKMPTVLAQVRPNIVIIALGANDGLQAKPISYIQENLVALVKQAKEYTETIYLVEMYVPPNLGAFYAQQFNHLFKTVSEQEKIPLLPFFLSKISVNLALIQPDGLHPTAEAQPLIMEHIFQEISPAL